MPIPSFVRLQLPGLQKVAPPAMTTEAYLEQRSAAAKATVDIHEGLRC